MPKSFEQISEAKRLADEVAYVGRGHGGFRHLLAVGAGQDYLGILASPTNQDNDIFPNISYNSRSPFVEVVSWATRPRHEHSTPNSMECRA